MIKILTGSSFLPRSIPRNQRRNLSDIPSTRPREKPRLSFQKGKLSWLKRRDLAAASSISWRKINTILTGKVRPEPTIRLPVAEILSPCAPHRSLAASIMRRGGQKEEPAGHEGATATTGGGGVVRILPV
jgi:hypothetical protein